MLDLCHISEEKLPKLYESYEAVGNITKELAKELGIKEDVKIVAGAGDNAAAAIGTGTVGNGPCHISLGTSGTIFLSSDKFSVDNKNALHSFCDASGKYHLMGCVLTAASARSWWLEGILDSEDYDKDESLLEDSPVLFAPYLVGERSPYNDVDIRGGFLNLSINTTRGQMSKAVLEGVAFALKDCLNVAKSNGINPEYTTICGGGSRSKTWRHIIADALEIPVKTIKTNQGPSFGAAILAMVGDKKYKDVQEATSKIIEVVNVIYPNENKRDYYRNKYAKYTKLYDALQVLKD